MSKFRQNLSNHDQPKKAVFFDRDGVLNIDHGYTHKIDDCHLVDGAAEAVRMVNDHGYQAFIVTNQGGIALGYYDEEQMNAFHDALLEKIKSATGGAITDIAFCPHHPRAEHISAQQCECRKPRPKMILDLAKTHSIDLSQSIMIGDRESDIEAGQSAGCRTVLFSEGRLDDALKPLISS